MVQKKAELSDKILEVLLKEWPIEHLTRGTAEEGKEYINILTDSMTAVLARMVVAYVGCAMALNPDMTEEEVIQVGETVHTRLASHMDFEANDLMQEISEKVPPDARNWN